ncbi:NAD(P)-dependent oxidoreductase [Salaquimonas pukyongi]|uniref:NAD(P)-dependent oxidoreductase n=1 Tax=Salaquimonas pukyongi TaxID=2712698 RepID=UPI00096B9D03|nr:NAD(P)-dependent oxidoreductase [Salaquimonas pukyongi]
MGKPDIAFLGTGLMGAPMAANLLKAGYAVRVWNRTAEKARPLASSGAVICDHPLQAVASADVVITMVSDGAAVCDLLFELQVSKAMGSGSIFIDMSSIKPAQARDHAARLAGRDIDCLDAPVSGGTKGAKAATLAIMVGGAQSAFDRAKPVLEAMGRPVRVGEAGAGQLAKLANQAIVASTIGVVAEAMLLAEKGGAEPAALRKALKGGFADSIILQQHGERMTTGNFTPGGRSATQLKDIDNIVEEATTLSLSLPLTEQMQHRYRRLVSELDGGNCDHSSIYLELKDRNGLS